MIGKHLRLGTDQQVTGNRGILAATNSCRVRDVSDMCAGREWNIKVKFASTHICICTIMFHFHVLKGSYRLERLAVPFNLTWVAFSVVEVNDYSMSS